MGNRSVALLGRDYTELGPLGAVALPSGGALAISRGQERKPYRYVDPNEDAALIVRTDDGVVLAVADGHNGVRASELAIDAVRGAADSLCTAELASFSKALEQTLEALIEPLEEVAPSRTSLVVAALTGDRCLYACVGDSSLFRASERSPVSVETQPVVGPALRFDAELRAAAFGEFQRHAGERVALVTDGVTNFVTLDSVPDLIAGDLDDGDCARAICRTAMRMGAGDNVAVAVYSGPV